MCVICKLDKNYSDQGLQVHMPKSLAVSQVASKRPKPLPNGYQYRNVKGHYGLDYVSLRKFT